MLSLLSILLILNVVHANLNLSHLRLKRLGHGSNHVTRSARLLNRADGDSVLGGLTGALGGTLNGLGGTVDGLGGTVNGLGGTVNGLGGSINHLGNPDKPDPANTSPVDKTNTVSSKGDPTTPSADPSTLSITSSSAEATSLASSDGATDTSSITSSPSNILGAPPATIQSSIPVSTPGGGGLGGILTSILGGPILGDPTPTPAPAPTPSASSPNPASSVPQRSDPSAPSSPTQGGILPPLSLPPILPLPVSDPAQSASDTNSASNAPQTSGASVASSPTQGGILPPLSLPPILPLPVSDPAQSASDTNSASNVPQPSGTSVASSPTQGGILPTLSLPPILPLPISDPSQSASDTNSASNVPQSSGTSVASSPTEGGILPTLSLPPILPLPISDPAQSASGTDTASTVPQSSASSSTQGGILPTLSLPPILPLPDPTASSSDASPSESVIPKPTDPPVQSSSETSSSSNPPILPPLSSIISLPPISSILPPVDPSSSASLPPVITPIPVNSTSNAPVFTPTNSGVSSAPTPNPTPAPISSSSGVGNQTAISGASSVLTGPLSSIFPSGISSSSPEAVSTISNTISAVIPSNSQFSFITESSLVVAPITTTSESQTLTDPDAVPSTTLVIIPTGTGKDATPTVPDIPPNLPTRIFSPDSVNPVTDAAELQGKTLISLLFQESLNWQFCYTSTQTVGQIFLYMPQVLSTALSISISDIKTYALQVQIPQGWKGDLNNLGTMYLAYIPSDQVNMLANMLRVTSSPFYSQTGIAGQLAGLVVPSFSLMSVTPGDAVTAPSGSNASSAASSNKTRTDAIIGVCAAVGGVAALVAIWWVLRYLQRQQAAKHRRLSNLSDPNLSNGVYGTQHDDRRTSFFYAEDELRGGYTDPAGFTAPAQPQAVDGSQMIQRMRPGGHTPISGPVLQQNSLNW